MIRIITIEREYGSGARDIARELAHRLAWKLWDDRLTQEIAGLAHSEQSAVRTREERRDPLYYRLFKSFALGSYEGSPNALAVKMLDADSIVRLSKRVVEQAADEGDCVILGRGSQHFLRSRTDTLRFFLYASAQEKSWRLVAEGKTDADAERLVATVDRERALSSRSIFTRSGRIVRSTTPCLTLLSEMKPSSKRSGVLSAEPFSRCDLRSG